MFSYCNTYMFNIVRKEQDRTLVCMLYQIPTGSGPAENLNMAAFFPTKTQGYPGSMPLRKMLENQFLETSLIQNFSKWERSDRSTSHLRHGLGLPLANSQSIIQTRFKSLRHFNTSQYVHKCACPKRAICQKKLRFVFCLWVYISIQNILELVICKLILMRPRLVYAMWS